MQLKTFTAPSLPEAIAQVRAALGGDAVILSDQADPAGGVVVTAAREMPPQAFDRDIVPESPVDPAIAATIEQVLAFHRMTPGLAERLQVAATAADGDTTARLAQALGAQVRFEPLRISPDCPLLVFGSHGSGKTTLAAKLCAEARLKGGEACLISMDVKAAGAQERAAALAQAMGVRHCIAEDMAAIAANLAECRGERLCVIETPAIAPFDDAKRQTLEARLKRLEGERILAQPAGLDAYEASEEAAAFAELGVRRIILSKLDLARRLGGSLTAAELAGLSLVSASQSASIGSRLVKLTPAVLARTMIAAAQGATSLSIEDSRR